MNKLPNYVPADDTNFGQWLGTMVAGVQESSYNYGLTPTQVTDLSNALNAYATALAAAQSPATKSATAVAAKNAARSAATTLAQIAAQQIKMNAAISDAAKVAIGVPTMQISPRPVTPPGDGPNLVLAANYHLQSQLYARADSLIPSKSQLPYGVAQLALYAALSYTPITDPRTLNFKLVFTRSPIPVPWTAGTEGQTAYIAGKWVTQTQATSPFGPILAVTIV